MSDNLPTTPDELYEYVIKELKAKRPELTETDRQEIADRILTMIDTPVAVEAFVRGMETYRKHSQKAEKDEN